MPRVVAELIQIHCVLKSYWGHDYCWGKRSGHHRSKTWRDPGLIPGGVWLDFKPAWTASMLTPSPEFIVAKFLIAVDVHKLGLLDRNPRCPNGLFWKIIFAGSSLQRLPPGVHSCRVRKSNCDQITFLPTELKLILWLIVHSWNQMKNRVAIDWRTSIMSSSTLHWLICGLQVCFNCWSWILPKKDVQTELNNWMKSSSASSCFITALDLKERKENLSSCSPWWHSYPPSDSRTIGMIMLIATCIRMEKDMAWQQLDSSFIQMRILQKNRLQVLSSSLT